MSLQEKLNRITELQQKIDSQGNLSPEVKLKVQYKLRLEWNYHSNSMEGNSLTKQETRSIMTDVIEVEGKPLKDLVEMRGHDSVIRDILQIGKGELRLSERRIKDIHKAIMYEDDPELRAKIGIWKPENNYLYTYENERFDFLDFKEVQDKMHELLNWLNAELDKYDNNKKNAPHPALLSCEFHLKYISIHPFYDGNGRTVRILSNLILISLGLPPYIIKTEEKTKYYKLLADIQAYGGDPDLLYEFLCEKIIATQELLDNALNGLNIDEPDDIEKGIDLLKKSLELLPGEIAKSEIVLQELWEHSLSKLFAAYILMSDKFTPLFEESDQNFNVKIGKYGHSKSKEALSQFFQPENELLKVSDLVLVTYLRNMKRFGRNESLRIDIKFTDREYIITNYKGWTKTKKYGTQLTSSEIEDLISHTGKALLEELNRISENGLKESEQ